MTEPVELTQAEVRMIRSLTEHLPVSRAGLPLESLEEMARRVAREEIASLAGKALRRTQDRDYSRDPDRNLAMEVTNEEAAQFWGEVLAEYGGD